MAERTFEIISSLFLPHDARGWLSLKLELLKDKIQPNKCEDRIGFLKRFVNWAASHHLSTRRVLQEVGHNGRFL